MLMSARLAVIDHCLHHLVRESQRRPSWDQANRADGKLFQLLHALADAMKVLTVET